MPPKHPPRENAAPLYNRPPCHTHTADGSPHEGFVRLYGIPTPILRIALSMKTPPSA